MTEPPSNLTSLRARLRNYARDVNSLEARVQRRLAALVVNEIFTSVDIGAEPPVLLKGGTALDLRRRPAPARLSKDWDAAVRGDLDEFIGKARVQLAAGWAGFTGRIAREQTVQVPGLEEPPRRFEVKLSYRDKPFATVPVEISTTEARAGDEHDVLQVSEYDTIGIAPTMPVYCLSLRYQIAQKIHACTAKYATTWSPTSAKPCSGCNASSATSTMQSTTSRSRPSSPHVKITAVRPSEAVSLTSWRI